MEKKWYERTENKVMQDTKPNKIPKGKWEKCPICGETLYKEDLKNNLYVCPKCNHYFRLTAPQRIELLTDKGSFRVFADSIISSDSLKFVSSGQSYGDKIKATMKKTGLNEAVIVGTGKINGIKAVLAVMDFRFLGGSMGTAVGEKITIAAEKALSLKVPLIIVSTSGGARMHEGIFSLMQMAKTSAALERLHKKKIPFISLMTDPTTGGVTASYAMLGDVNIAEPQALIGFAGPRVIEQTIKEKLPEGFQRSEFLLMHGFVDAIFERKDMKNSLATILSYLS